MKQKIISILAIIFLSTALSGCLLGLGTAAGGAGGYWYGKEEKFLNDRQKKTLAKKREFEARQQNAQSTSPIVAQNVNQDQRIALNLNTKLLGGGLTKVIAIYPVIKDGVVTLYGNVPNSNVAKRAVDIARRTPGVRGVISNIVVIGFKITPVINNTKKESNIPVARKEPPKKTVAIKPIKLPWKEQQNQNYQPFQQPQIEQIKPEIQEEIELQSQQSQTFEDSAANYVNPQYADEFDSDDVWALPEK